LSKEKAEEGIFLDAVISLNVDILKGILVKIQDV